jgi:hypothetical protein
MNHINNCSRKYLNSLHIKVVNSTMIRLAGHIALMGKIHLYKVLVGKPEGKRPLARPRHRWDI